jgi:hypothetical protein
MEGATLSGRQCAYSIIKAAPALLKASQQQQQKQQPAAAAV